MEAGEILLEKLHQRQLAPRAAQSDSLPLTRLPIGVHLEDVALRALGEEVGLDFVDLGEAEVDLSLLSKFPQKFIHRETLFPIRQNNGTLVVATNDPFNLYPLDELSVVTGQTVIPVLAKRSEIVNLIKTHLGVGSETVEGLLAQTDNRVELLEELQTDGSELGDGSGNVGGAAGQRSF
jgi:general secretion pathway protein E/type IV pilus assembly protein PilB